MSLSAVGFHGKAASANGEKVVLYGFLDKRKKTRWLMSPGSKHAGKSARDADEEIVGEKRDGCRSMVPTAHYVAVDRPDLQHTSVLMRTLETPLKLQEM